MAVTGVGVDDLPALKRDDTGMSEWALKPLSNTNSTFKFDVTIVQVLPWA